jgi:hypothetical protein
VQRTLLFIEAALIVLSVSMLLALRDRGAASD